MVKLVDTPDLESGAAMRVGSSPILGIQRKRDNQSLFSVFFGEIIRAYQQQLHKRRMGTDLLRKSPAS